MEKCLADGLHQRIDILENSWIDGRTELDGYLFAPEPFPVDRAGHGHVPGKDIKGAVDVDGDDRNSGLFGQVGRTVFHLTDPAIIRPGSFRMNHDDGVFFDGLLGKKQSPEWIAVAVDRDDFADTKKNSACQAEALFKVGSADHGEARELAGGDAPHNPQAVHHGLVVGDDQVGTPAGNMIPAQVTQAEKETAQQHTQ